MEQSAERPAPVEPGQPVPTTTPTVDPDRGAIARAVSASGANSVWAGVVGGLVAGLVALVCFVLVADVGFDLARRARTILLAGLVPALVSIAVLGWPDLVAGQVRAALARTRGAIVLAVAGGLIGLIISDWIFYTVGGLDSEIWQRRIVVIGFAIVAGSVGFGTGLGQSLRRAVVGLVGGLAGGALAGAIVLSLDGSRQLETTPLLVALPLGTTVLGAAIGGADRAARRTWIEFVDGPMAGRQVNLYRNPAVLGSDPGVDVVLSEGEIAGQHASLVRHGDAIWLDPLAPGASIRINRVIVDGRAQIGSGDVVSIGSYYLRVRAR